MAERRASITERELESALISAGGQIDFPPAPDLAGRVIARLSQPQLPHSRLRLDLYSPRLRAVVAVILVAFALLAAVLTIPPARHAVADLLGLRGVSIVFMPDLATSTIIPSGSPSPGALLLGGRNVSLAEARGTVSFPVLLPSATLIGRPDAVYVAGAPPSGYVTLAYAPRPGLPETRETGVGLLITQFRGESIPFIQKGLPRGATATPVSVNGARAFWIAGVPHLLLIRDSRGEIHEQPSRLAANTLLWERDGITYRLESSLDLDASVRIAESMR